MTVSPLKNKIAMGLSITNFNRIFCLLKDFVFLKDSLSLMVRSFGKMNLLKNGIFR
jgi:hypothetical protein